MRKLKLDDPRVPQTGETLHLILHLKMYRKTIECDDEKKIKYEMGEDGLYEACGRGDLKAVRNILNEKIDLTKNAFDSVLKYAKVNVIRVILHK